MKLPFLKGKFGDARQSPQGEKQYGYSEDDELQEHSLDELLSAFESHDHKKMMSAIMALVQIIKNKESNAAHSQ